MLSLLALIRLSNVNNNLTVLLTINKHDQEVSDHFEQALGIASEFDYKLDSREKRN